jgi:hypothetical protein
VLWRFPLAWDASPIWKRGKIQQRSSCRILPLLAGIDDLRMKSAWRISFQKVQALGLCGNLPNARTFKTVCFQFGKRRNGPKGAFHESAIRGPNSLLVPANIRYLGFRRIATLASSPPPGLQLGASPPLTQDRVVRAPHEPKRRVVESPPLQPK